MEITTEKLKKVFKKKGYKFCSGPFNLNIFGVRDLGGQRDTFNDFVGVAYQDDLNRSLVELFPATTDPGIHWLRNPLNSKGTLIMLEGQYKSAYTIGKHGRSGLNPYEALEQCNEMAYVRDNNKDDQYDIDPSKKISGIFKTNIHRASAWKILQLIGKYSAGCQVIKDPNQFLFLMSLAHKQIQYGFGNKFSYTLLNKDDF